MQTIDNHLRLSRTWTFRGNLGEDVSGCHPDFQSFILFVFYVLILVSLSCLVYIVKSLYYCTSVLKSTLFTPDFFPLSFLSILDLSCPSEIGTFKCYEGTAYKLRPHPFRTYSRVQNQSFCYQNLTISWLCQPQPGFVPSEDLSYGVKCDVKGYCRLVVFKDK
jgi:hypothetical protein